MKRQKHRTEQKWRWVKPKHRFNLLHWLAAPRMSWKIGYRLSKCGRVIEMTVIHGNRGTQIYVHRHKLRNQPLPWRKFFARLIRDLRRQLAAKIQKPEAARS